MDLQKDLNETDTNHSQSSDDIPQPYTDDSFEPPDPDTNQINKQLAAKNNSETNERKSATDDDYFNEEDVQEVSIHKISLKKFKPSGADLTENELETVIQNKIIDDYNSPSEGENKSGDKKRKFEKKKYEEHDVDEMPVVNTCDKGYFEGEDFQIKIYVQEVPKTLKILSNYGIKCESKAVHCIIFHYRKNELYALTTGQAYNVVHKHADMDFPMKIAARILSEKGQIETTNKVLIGNERQNKKSMKNSVEFNPLQQLEICTSFTAELRENASICKLSCFRKNKQNSSVKLQVSLSSIRFLRRLKTSDFISILDHLSKISNGQVTHKCTANEENKEIEKDTEVHQRYLTLTTTDKKKHLDIVLANEIRKAINREETFLAQYDFCHKHIDDFMFATEYHLFHKNIKIETYGYCPTLQDVIKTLRENESVESELLKESNMPSQHKPDAFLTAINEVKMSYTKHTTNTETPKEKLMNYIEGCLMDREGRSNWKIKSTWCVLRNEYLLIVHKQWLALLKDCLVTPDPSVREMLSKYTSNNNAEAIAENNKCFFLWESLLPGENSDKLFDILEISEDKKITLYFTINSIECADLTKTNLQILNASLKMKKEIIRKRGQDENNVFVLLFKKKALQNVYNTLNEFIQNLEKAKIVLSIKTENGDILHKESLRKTQILETDLLQLIETSKTTDTESFSASQKVFRNSNEERNKAIANIILNILEQYEYIDEMGNISSKVLIAKSKLFIAELNRPTTEYILRNIIQHYKSLVPFLTPKLFLVNLRKCLLQNDWTSFEIIEVNNE